MWVQISDNAMRGISIPSSVSWKNTITGHKTGRTLVLTAITAKCQATRAQCRVSYVLRDFVTVKNPIIQCSGTDHASIRSKSVCVCVHIIYNYSERHPKVYIPG